MSLPPDKKVKLMMTQLPPEARAALNVMAEMQKREPEDVLRDEMQKYIKGKVPAIDLTAITGKIKEKSFTAGYLAGRLRVFARKWTADD